LQFQTLDIKLVPIHLQAMGAKKPQQTQQLGDLIAVAEFAPNSLLE
jgi:hypothetical protein